MTGLVVRKVANGGTPKLRLVRVGPKLIGGGVVKLERVQVTCPACGEELEAVARDGQVKGYCAVAGQYVNFAIETQSVHIGINPSAETRAKLSAAAKKLWQNPEYRTKQTAAHMGRNRLITAETRAKISAAKKGKHPTAETRVKLSAAHMGKSRPLTAETRAKISSALKKQYESERAASERSG